MGGARGNWREGKLVGVYRMREEAIFSLEKKIKINHKTEKKCPDHVLMANETSKSRM